MYGNRQQSFVSEMMPDSGGDTSMTPIEKSNTLMCKLVQVEGDGSFLPASEDDVIEVEHLFAEPKNDKVLADNILCFNTDVPNKCLANEDFPCTVGHDHMRSDSGTLDSNTTREVKEESKFEFLDGVLNGADGEGDLHITNGLSIMCDDYLLDADFAEVSELDYGSWGGSCLGDIGLQSHSSELRGRNSHTYELSELSTPTFSVPESSSDPNAMSLEKMSIYELQKTFSSTFGRETSVSDKEWLKHRFSLGLQNLVEFENVSSLLECGVQTNENEGGIFTSCNDSSGRMHQRPMIAQGSKIRPLGRGVERENLAAGVELVTNSPQSGKVGVELLDLGDREGLLLRRKRLRKPTRRYIEESSALKARYYTGKLETPTTSSRNKFLHVKSHNQLHRKGFGSTPLVCRQDYLNGSGIQVPFGLRVRKGRLKRSKSISGYDSENNKEDKDPSRNSGIEPSAESEDEMSDECVTTIKTGKGEMRRKHHRLWTLSEVMKLIDGVSRYGVGRWTEIKRLLFSASAYRTSVDLKDKWRNLLRASCAQLHNKREVEQGRKNASQPIPQSVLRRVSELAIIYPYPRQRKSKLLCATPITATPESGTPVSRCGRIVHRKSFT
ncbi:uncharacterized protein LOC122654747 [Telopea speciosissima]|uniref:uncharacterized protein LOC122654747 n=1 Tax=Telopea speciosissima TaxID=54955 RepID=UPI001CC6CFEF|nr:uncharacterized protein LOC122654747 [Telopea speciosissima]XP_043704918.1 uncharacterized protein LOC122654747 [Telopea speciosissima]